MRRLLPFLAVVALVVACKAKPKDPMSACSSGDANACASMCDHQPGPICEVAATHDPPNATKYLAVACTAKDDQACEKLVVLYTGAHDLAKAQAFADQACAGGSDSIACKDARRLIVGTKSRE